MGVFRRLKNEDQKTDQKEKPKNLNETRGILLKGMKTRKIAKILKVHQRKGDKSTRTSR